LAIESFPYLADFSKPFGVHRRRAPLMRRFRAGCAATQGEAVFQIVAVPFDAYAALPSPTHRWLLTCLARYANRAGEAYPTMRALAQDAGMSLASVSRYLKVMHDLGVFQRRRLPGGGRYLYTLAEPYRLRWPERVSASQNRVSQAGTREQVTLAKHVERARFANSGVNDGLPRQVDWEPRLRAWATSRFWLPQWGAQPGDPGCFAPPALVQTVL
jgi:hypothetical protein